MTLSVFLLVIVALGRVPRARRNCTSEDYSQSLMYKSELNALSSNVVRLKYPYWGRTWG